ncbi:flagellar hook-length control protein FliK [Neobacillus rhizophilus]|nr:flagellar hook-length control protein FliK [Neobacillus rhizophilus]
MIPSTSMSSTSHKLSEKASSSKPENQQPSSFMELLNALKNGTDSPQNLISMVDQVLEQPDASNQELDQDSEQQTRDDLLAFISSFFEKTNPALAPLQTTIADDAHNEGKQALPALQTELEGIFGQKKAQELIKSFQEQLKSNQNSVQVQNPLQQPIQFVREQVHQLQNAGETQQNRPASKLESDVDFKNQPFDGKEVIFQSLHRPGESDMTAVKDEPSHLTKVTKEQLAAEVMGLLKNPTHLHKGSDIIEAKFSLTPEHLGEIDIKIVIQKGQVTAQFLADTAHGKEMLDSQMSLLKASLQQQGFQVDKIEVAQSGQTLQNQFSQQDNRSQQDQSQQRQSKKKVNRDEFYQSHNTIDTYLHRESDTTINILA